MRPEANLNFVKAITIVRPVAYTSIGKKTLRWPYKIVTFPAREDVCAVGTTKEGLPVVPFKINTEIVEEDSNDILLSLLISLDITLLVLEVTHRGSMMDSSAATVGWVP